MGGLYFIKSETKRPKQRRPNEINETSDWVITTESLPFGSIKQDTIHSKKSVYLTNIPAVMHSGWAEGPKMMLMLACFNTVS